MTKDKEDVIIWNAAIEAAAKWLEDIRFDYDQARDIRKLKK